MTFTDRVVVMNGGRIEQIGRPRAKRERSPNQSVALMVPRGGVPWASNINAVRWQTAARGSFDPQRLSGALANHHCIELKRKPTGPRKCRSLAEIARNHIYVVPQNQAKT